MTDATKPAGGSAPQNPSDAPQSAKTTAPDARYAAVARRRRSGRVLRIGATALILLFAVGAAAFMWEVYVTSPWTRDGRVRVQVANIAPQVSGQIVDVKVVDNQTVRAGDILYVIDPADFRIALESADSEIASRKADLQVKKSQSARREALTTISTSVEEKQQYAGTADMAQAAFATAQAQRSQAKINLDRTEVRSTVNGRITNLLMRVGDYATTGTTNIRIVDTDSFWIDGYFEETKVPQIRVGDAADVALMGYGDHIRGTVESITLGISTSNAAASTQGLPNVDPVYTWVRLAQRVPVRIRIEAVPPGVTLVAGMTATISVVPQEARPSWLDGLRRMVTAGP